jgi:hypothetical protein
MTAKPLFPDKSASTLTQYVEALSTISGDGILWFRGQTNWRSKLRPSLARRRGDWIADETMLMRRFRQNASALVPAAQRSDWDWLLLMQHHGVPTRLLDWTENALAALYFAVVSQRGRPSRSDGCVWVLDPVALNIASSVVVASNAIPTLDVDPVLSDYQPNQVALAANSLGPVAVLAVRMFPRLIAQSGVFTLVHRDRTPLEQIRDSAYVGRILIPNDAKAAITQELSVVGVRRLSLFPELESVAEYTKSFLS